MMRQTGLPTYVGTLSFFHNNRYILFIVPFLLCMILVFPMWNKSCFGRSKWQWHEDFHRFSGADVGWWVGATLGARRTFWPAGNTVARFEKRRVRWSTVERWDRLGSKTEVRGGPSWANWLPTTDQAAGLTTYPWHLPYPCRFNLPLSDKAIPLLLICPFMWISNEIVTTTLLEREVLKIYSDLWL